MWRKVLYAAIYWLALSETLAEAEKTVNSSIVKDNASAESAPRLYRNVPIGVYASAAPYASFSFQVPAYITAPKAAASRIIPVKEQLLLHNTNGYLRDSYGNKFVGAPQAAAYKSAFPQQFVPLQGLPAHLSQPLLAASPQVKQSSPHYFVGSHYRYPTFQVAGSTHGSSQGSFSSPFVYAENLRNFTPVSTAHLQVQGGTAAQQQANNNNPVNSDAITIEQFKNYNGPKFQRYEYKPELSHNNEANNGAPTDDKSQIQAAAAKTAVTAIVNGQKTVINLDTKPALPLLDLSLLEPLRFENPLVPQVQHFLPRINDETYRALHEFNSDQEKPPKKEFVVQKTKIYDNGIVKAKPRKEIPKKKPNYPVQHDINRQIPVQPTIIVKGTPNLGPEIIYEINEPNYKETYKEQSISYNKETQSEPVHINYDSKNEAEPVHYSYDKVVKKEPVTYSFVHSKKTPLEITHAPRQLIYTYHNEDSNKNHAESEDANSSEDTGPTEHNGSSEDSGSVEDIQGEEPVTNRNHNPSHERHHKSAAHIQNEDDDKPEHREQEYHHKPSEQSHFRPSEQIHLRPSEQSHHRPSEQSHHRPLEKSHYRPSEQRPLRPSEQSHFRPSEQSDFRPTEQSHHRTSVQSHHRPSEQNHQRSNDEHHHRPNNQYHPHQKDYIRRPNEQHANSHRQHHHKSNENHQHRPKEEYQHKQHPESHEGHRPAPKEAYHQRPVENYHHNNPNEEVSHGQSQPVEAPIKQVQPQYQEYIPLQYEEDIRQEEPVQHAEIRVDPVQHLQQANPLPESVDDDHFSQKQKSVVPFGGGTPVIHEKAKRIIIQEESPEEKHMHQEQIMAEVFDQENNNEEDFENAYKNAAIGFEAFEKKAADIERDIYNPAAYGNPPKGFDLDKTPFHQYHAEGETFPKSSRLRYKDDRDNLKEDYYLMYSANRPESLSDRYKNKANYYKLYKENKPEKYFPESQDKKKAKYTAAPTYDFFEPKKQKTNKYFAQYKSEPIKYEYDYSKETPRDNSAHASRPYQRLRSRTHFVEPQFQYGFEPVALPRLLDSELAAMASNDSPESEKPGMRKKIYHENWYIKKTSTTGGAPS